MVLTSDSFLKGELRSVIWSSSPRTRDRLGEDAAETERIYSEQWHAALEHLLVSQGIFDIARIDVRAGAFAAGERTAEEFVRGEQGH